MTHPIIAPMAPAVLHFQAADAPIHPGESQSMPLAKDQIEDAQRKRAQRWLKKRKPIQRSFLQDADEVGNLVIKTPDATADIPEHDPPSPPTG